jgi:signal transduction histidine kinase
LQKADKSQEEKDFLFNEIKTNIGEAVSAAKRIANNLMPSTLNDYGLIAALDVFAQTVMRSGAVVIHLLGERDMPRLERNSEINIYRICTELINNTLKHAAASNIYLEIKAQNNWLFLNYHDDGTGFDFKKTLAEKPASHGLKNIVTRVQFLKGRILDAEKPSNGTSFQLEIPLN